MVHLLQIRSPQVVHWQAVLSNAIWQNTKPSVSYFSGLDDLPNLEFISGCDSPLCLIDASLIEEYGGEISCRPDVFVFDRLELDAEGIAYAVCTRAPSTESQFPVNFLLKLHVCKLQVASQKLLPFYQNTTATYRTEQEAFSRYLVDDISPLLVAALMHLDSVVPHILAKGVVENIAESSTLLHQCTKKIRALAKQICPSTIESYGLEAALHELVNDAEDMHPYIRFKRDIQLPDNKIAESAYLAIYRIAQGLFSGLVSETNATEVTLRVFSDDHALCIHVEDSGAEDSGNEPLQPFYNHLGSFYQHMEAVNGTLSHVSSKPQGRIFVVNVPFISKNKVGFTQP